jgi:hypothetical protein
MLVSQQAESFRPTSKCLAAEEMNHRHRQQLEVPEYENTIDHEHSVHLCRCDPMLLSLALSMLPLLVAVQGEGRQPNPNRRLFI